MRNDIGDLKGRVQEYASSGKAPKPHKNTTPLANALAAISNHFDTPLSPYAIEHTTPFSGIDAGSESLQLIGEAIGLSLEPLKAKRALKNNNHFPILIINKSVTFVVWEIKKRDRNKIASVSKFHHENPDGNGIVEVESGSLLEKDSAAFICNSNRGQEETEPLIRVRSFFKSPLFSSEALFATLAINIIGLAIPLFTMNVYDRVLPNFSLDTLTVLAIGVCIAATFDFVLRLLRAHIVDATARRVDVLFLNRIFGRYLSNTIAKRKANVGADVNAFRDTDTIRDFHSSTSLTVFGDLPFILIFLGVIALVGGPLVWVTMTAIILMLLVGVVVQRPLARISEEAYRDTAHRNTVLVETINGIETLKATGAERHATKRWEKSVAAQVRSGVKSKSYTNFALSFMIFAQMIATVALIYFGVKLIIAGTITAGAMMACMIIQGRAMAPVSQLAGLILRIYQVRVAEGALNELQTRPVERGVSTQFIKHPKIEGAFKLEEVSFTYDEDGGAYALKNINLEIQKGERIGIIGASGSGKTTLLKLLAKLHSPDTGRIFVDGIGLSALDPAEVRREIGWAGSDSALFAGTIRENLTMHMPNVADKNILNAVRLSGALQWINNQPMGFDTPLSEGGANLSSGQRQTLVLARAFVSDPAILLLDEPTSAMDGRLEKQVIDSLKQAQPGNTMLIVTHRSSLFELVDRLIVIEKGEIVLDGTKAYVIAKLQGETAARKRTVTVSQASEQHASARQA